MFQPSALCKFLQPILTPLAISVRLDSVLCLPRWIIVLFMQCICVFLLLLLFYLYSYFSRFLLFYFCTGKSVTIRKKAIRNDWLIEIAKRHPVSLAMVQCHGDKLSENTLRELFKEIAPKLKVSWLWRFIAECVDGEWVGGGWWVVWLSIGTFHRVVRWTEVLPVLFWPLHVYTHPHAYTLTHTHSHTLVRILYI